MVHLSLSVLKERYCQAVRLSKNASDMDIMPISLLEYNRRINAVINNAALQRCWIVAETVDVAVRGGHCYLDLVQKNPETNAIVAKSRAIIWSSVFFRLSRYFEEMTGQKFATGLKVMVEVSANFHEQYGLSLVISNINPSYTLGDIARLRLEILKRLKNEGLINLNKSLLWSEIPQRIAVISADSAAGYGDFVSQLNGNPDGLVFYTSLFRSYMQGVNAVPSIIDALERVKKFVNLFDCVVIIRGGGATTDLNIFDNYDLAATVARFPLPVIVGIGHTRDYTVLDEVASVSVKTPTAAAEFLINKLSLELRHLEELQDTIVSTVENLLNASKQELNYYSSTIPLTARRILQTQESLLSRIKATIPMAAKSHIERGGQSLKMLENKLQMVSENTISREKLRLDSIAKQVELLSPMQVLKRGYSLVTVNGKCVTSASQINTGDVIVNQFADGNIESKVK